MEHGREALSIVIKDDISMSKVKHVGVRPKYPLVGQVKVRARTFYQIEELPDGGKKWWSVKDLNSGCDNVVDKTIGMHDLIFCKYCDEWYAQKQFIDEEK